MLVDVDRWFSGAYRSVGVKVGAHVLNLEFQLVLGALVGALKIIIRKCASRFGVWGVGP